MKHTFENIKQLVDHCSYCVVCKKYRTVEINVHDPDDLLEVNYWTVENNILSFSMILNDYSRPEEKLRDDESRRGTKYLFRLDINIINNLYQYTISGSVCELNSEGKDKTKAGLFELSFYLYAVCKSCSGSVTSEDVNIHLDSSTIFKFSLDIEDFYIQCEKNNYRIHYRYLRDVIDIYKIDKKNNNFINSKPLRLPIMPIDFSDQAKTISQIKTLITFS